MEYRDQLKYIKSNQHDNKKTSGKSKHKRKKITAFDKFIWKVFFILSVIFVLLMVYVDLFPVSIMIIAGGLLLIVLMVVKILQQRACRNKGKKRKSKGRFLCVLMIVSLIFGGYYLWKINEAIENISIEGGSGELYGIDVVNQPFNIYISGIDVYGDLTKESRSDVNLVVTINPHTHKILITTTPRDYYVTIPGVSGEQRDKLTHAGNYGIETSIATLENLYNTEIPFYARVNFTSVIDIVDAMGGVNVESEVAFTTSKAAGTVVEIKEGKNHLNGKEALAFVRERKAFIDGDHQRGKNQQAMLTALIKKVVSPMILVQANDMIDGIVGNAETNMSEEQMKALIKMQLDGFKGWEIESVAATGDDSGKQYCYSYSGAPLYVCVPDAAVVESIQQKMDEYCNEMSDN